MLRMKRHRRPRDPATAPCGGTVGPGGRFRRQPSPSNHRPADAASLARIRGIALAAVTAVSLAPVAAVSPSPSPSLGTLLAAPPASNYVVDTQAFMRVEGAFDVAEYVNFLAPSNPSDMETTLKHDGFVSGFGRSWAQQGTTHLLLEIVVAFSGGTGAKSWLAASQAADSSNQYFKGAIVVSGVDPSYGGHFADPATPAYADIVALGVGLIRRSKRRPMMAMYAAPPGGVQLSPDGNYWWDGQAWRDASREAPPAALRSVDGYYWWDGRTWRAVPQPTST